jgi:mitochondrial splicing suppressor protein 51
MAESTPTAVPVNGGILDHEPAGSSTDTIYYIKTHIPHLDDFTMFGPFHCPEAAVPSIQRKLQQTSVTGLDAFNEILSSAPNGIESFEHLEAPLSNGKTMVIQLVKEQNPELAAALPSSSWVVLCCEIAGASLASMDKEPRIKKMDICGSFLTIEKANEAAQQVVEEKLRGMQGGKKIKNSKSNGALMSAIISPTQGYLVQVKRDSGAESFDEPEPVCSACYRPQIDFTSELKRCAQCLTARYCSRECQKKDWKTHKLTCAPPGGKPAPPKPKTQRHNPGFHAMNSALGLTNDDYLHELPEEEALRQLIDCFRMRVEDEYVFGEQNIGIYGGENPLPEFRRFLRLAESRAGLLPPWWNKDKEKECERIALARDGWNNINCAVEKSDIQEHYKDPTMPMKLRILGEKIYGKGFM